jgi:diacylglycerol kinase (CTP)
VIRLNSNANKIEVIPFRARSDVHLARKVWHMSAGLIGLYVYLSNGWTPLNTAWGLMGLALFGFTLDFVRMHSIQVNRVVMVLTRPIMRECEKNGPNSAPFYAMGISLALFLFPEKIAILSVLYLAFADPISSFVGVNFGKDKILPGKSLQGALAGFITCYMITLVYGLNYSNAVASFDLLAFALLAGIIGSLSELCSVFKIDDNLTIPVISGLGLTLLNLLFGLF